MRSGYVRRLDPSTKMRWPLFLWYPVRPRIEDFYAGLLVVVSILRNNGETIMNRSSSDNEVRLREFVPNFAAALDKQAPLEHDLLIKR